MSDRRAVSAGHLGASSVATANETWRVAVGGNRVENMTVDQIAHAFQSGHLNVRTPLWPPGTTGWQALGNFEQFQMNQAAYGGNQGGLAQFEEADDDPTRMWTGGNEFDLPGMEGMGAPPPSVQQRPMARTGVRQVAQPSRPVPMPSRPAPVTSVSSARPAPTASLPPSRSASVAPASIPPFRKSRGNGLMLVAGLVGLVGLGSAVLAARGNWGQSEPAQVAETAPAETASAEVTSAPKAEAPIPVLADPAPTKAEAVGEARLAKYEDTPSAFVAGEQKPAANAQAKKAADEPAKADEAKAEEAKADEASAEESNAEAKAEEAKARADSRSEKASKASKAKAEKAMKVSSRATAKRAAAAPLARSKPEPTVEKVEKAEKPEKVEKVEKAEKAAEAPQAPASSAVNESAAAALASSASLASSCRPRGGPAGAGKARVIYSNDGEVQSVEILTAKFRDTLTGSCVRMVFRRAKIPAFKGEPPTFIKSFTIPEE